MKSMASDFIHAIDLGRIVVVDPACREAVEAVNYSMRNLTVFLAQRVPRNFVGAPQYATDLMTHVLFLEMYVDRLVDQAVTRLGPVLPWGVRLRRFWRRFDAWAAAKTAEWHRLEEAEQLDW